MNLDAVGGLVLLVEVALRLGRAEARELDSLVSTCTTSPHIPLDPLPCGRRWRMERDVRREG